MAPDTRNEAAELAASKVTPEVMSTGDHAADTKPIETWATNSAAAYLVIFPQFTTSPEDA